MPYHHFFNHSSGGSSSFWGAFLGAFFAFVFGFITYIVTRRRERFVQHKNALIKLERVLLKHLNDLATLETLANGMKKNASESKHTSNRLFSLEIPSEIDIELGSLDLANKLFLYRTSVDRLNLNIGMVNHALDRLESLAVNGQPLHPVNFGFIVNQLEALANELPQFSEKTTKFLMLIRIHEAKTKDKNSFVYGVIHAQWEQDISQKEIEDDNKKFAAEKNIQDDIF